VAEGYAELGDLRQIGLASPINVDLRQSIPDEALLGQLMIEEAVGAQRPQPIRWKAGGDSVPDSRREAEGKLVVVGKNEGGGASADGEREHGKSMN
jgi:hypothetical protein